MSTLIDSPSSANRSHDSAECINGECLHCGLPIAADAHGEDQRFCCSGCHAAYQLISGEGLEEYYELRRKFSDRPESSVDPELAAHSFVDLDAPRFTEQHVQLLPGGRMQTTLRLHGIHCAACVWLLERMPQIQPGVIDARVNLPKSTIDLVWHADQVKLSQIAHQVASLGYRAAPLGSSKLALEQKKLVRQQLVQIAIAGACSGNVMLLALAIYLGEWTGMAAEHLQLLRFACTAVGLVSLLGPGSVFFRGAWAAIRTRTSHMDLPIALGLGVGAVSGVWNTLAGHGELYYDSLSMLVFLLLIGRALQAWQQRSACDAVDLLQQLTPGTALRVRDGLVETVPIEAIVPGDILEVRAGDMLPVDGSVVLGTSEIDTSLLTGESLPQVVAIGDEVTAGTLNHSRTLRIQAVRVGTETRLAGLLTAIEQAGIQKTPIVQWADRVSGIFVMVVTCVALVVGTAWWFIDREVWSDRVIAVLIVACPCALGLATPLAIAVALGRSARRGVLIKGGGPLQRLARPGTLILDKTGTLTEGCLTILEWQGDQRALAWAAAAEVGNQHPVAQALRAELDRRESSASATAQNITSHLGSGVSAWIEGHKVVVGNRKLQLSEGCAMEELTDAKLNSIVAGGQSPLLVSIDGRVAGVAALGDSLRPEAQQVLERLALRGWKLHILSGDHPRIVAQLAERLRLPGENCHGGVSPEGKLEFVQACLNAGGPVVMVGDGVNDAAALAAADVGIAVRGGAEASMQAADIYLANGSLAGIEDIICSSQRTLRIIRRNSVASLLYNFMSVSLASVGWLHPLAAALLMPVSSLTVVAVTLWGQADPKTHRQSHRPKKDIAT